MHIDFPPLLVRRTALASLSLYKCMRKLEIAEKWQLGLAMIAIIFQFIVAHSPHLRIETGAMIRVQCKSNRATTSSRTNFT